MLTRTIQTTSDNIEELRINKDGIVTVNNSTSGTHDTIKTKKLTVSFTSEAGERFTFSIANTHKQEEEVIKRKVDAIIEELASSGWFDKSRNIEEIKQKVTAKDAELNRDNINATISKRLKNKEGITKRGSLYFRSF